MLIVTVWHKLEWFKSSNYIISVSTCNWKLLYTIPEKYCRRCIRVCPAEVYWALLWFSEGSKKRVPKIGWDPFQFHQQISGTSFLFHWLFGCLMVLTTSDCVLLDFSPQESKCFRKQAPAFNERCTWKDSGPVLNYYDSWRRAAPWWWNESIISGCIYETRRSWRKSFRYVLLIIMY